MKNIFISLLLCVSIISFLFAGEIEKEILLQKGDMLFSKEQGFDVVFLPKGALTMEIGLPMLPCISIKLLIPPNATATKVEVVSSTKETISGEFNIIPGQQPTKLNASNPPPFIEPNPIVYKTKELYPGR